VDIRLSTHDAGGITERDFRLAARIDAAAAVVAADGSRP
jgi:pterin-4a-carbinolamine dehydratase